MSSRSSLKPCRRLLRGRSVPDSPPRRSGLRICAEKLDKGAHALTETPEELWLPSLCLAAELTGWIGAESPNRRRA